MWEPSEGAARVLDVLLNLLPGGLWCAWWLWAANWRKLWPVLAQGAWVPVVLLMILATLVWSHIAPQDRSLLGVTWPNVWWQLGCVCALVLIALFCGWLQGQLGWTPPEVSVEPPEVSHEHAHAVAHH